MAKRMQYGEETVVMRVPKSMVKEIKNLLESRKVIESVKIDVSKQNPVIAQVLNNFMSVCAKQMGGYIASLELDAREAGDTERLKALETMRPYFQDMVGSSNDLERLT